jgi:hypothetical protein
MLGLQYGLLTSKQRGKLSGYIFVTKDEDAAAVRKGLTPIVRKLDRYLKFGIADAVEYGPMAKNFGLVEDTFPALVIHAPHNDNVFIYKQGRQILGSVVEDMLNSILHAKAQPGQVFGEDAPEFQTVAEEPDNSRHDEL